MTYLQPNIDTRHIIKSAMNSKSLGTLGKEEDRRNLLQALSHYTPIQIANIEAKKYADVKEWSKKDDVLTKLGFLVSYKTDSSNGTCKSISGFDSNWANQKLKQYKIPITEKALISGVTEIENDCNLRNTKLESLGTVEQIDGNLILYTDTPIKDLGSLKKVKGSVCIYAKNEQEKDDFIKKVNLDTSKIKGKVVLIPRMYC